MLDWLYKIFTSLKLTVVLLALGLVLVFLGTTAQEPLGLYAAQNSFFRSFFVDSVSLYAALHKTADIFFQGFGFPLDPLSPKYLLEAKRFPIFPGGYFVGGLLLINLFAAHLRYYRPGMRKFGVALIHLGVVLLLVGQLMTDMLSSESSMHIRNGQTKNYSEADRSFELAVVDTTESDSDKVVAIPGRMLASGAVISHPEMPLTLKVQKFFVNSHVVEEATNHYAPVNATAGFASDVFWRELPHETAMDRRDMPSATIEVIGKSGSLGTYLLSAYLSRPQKLSDGGRSFELALRPTRFYKPFSLHLLEFRHDKYAGTDIPKNFSSRVRLQRPDTGEDREINIYMNNPLRYAGETYYQSSFDPDDQGTVLQVVRNPGWLTPYLACGMVALGMCWQFLSHLLRFATKPKAA